MHTISIYDFEFVLVYYGLYRVYYTSPKTNKEWKGLISDMTLIDATKNAIKPKKKDLNRLKKIIKNYQY